MLERSKIVKKDEIVISQNVNFSLEKSMFNFDLNGHMTIFPLTKVSGKIQYFVGEFH